ncbi:alpha/beta fold hydrolase [Catenuloplanes japonicus]|uniref:alpha/beta fold hydrolase n=1 Tax=Catenuloplanes japonicus TaxID=33876 RepID=UPI000526D6A3|nr:alpha/beta hydrolase [Catenuloplanes japonicus]
MTAAALHDLGGDGPPVLMIPGLCGTAPEWSATAEWITKTHRGYVLEPRGHGQAARRPDDVSRAAHIADTAEALDRIGPAVVIGQSLGGHTAMLTAAAHPELVTRLVLAEAGPGGPDQDTVRDIGAWLDSWPVPFPGLDTAAAFLGGGLVGPAWAAGLRQDDDGWWPACDADVMTATLAAAIGPRWAEFESISCPTLLVTGEHGVLPADEIARMELHPAVRSVTIPGAGHDVHLDSPAAWRAAVTDFLG